MLFFIWQTAEICANVEKMLNIALIDDNPEDNQILKENLERFAKEDNSLFSTSLFGSADAFLKKDLASFDLVFLDIDMPGTNGLETAKLIRKKDETIPLVFVTNLYQFAIRGYEVNALDFILKPVEYDSFVLKMRRIKRLIQYSANKKITVHWKNGDKIIDVGDVDYVEVRGHYLMYHLSGGESITTRGKISSLEKEYDSYGFCRCNNYYLVNLKNVDGVEKQKVLIGKDSLPISRTKKQSFLNRLAEYLGGLK